MKKMGANIVADVQRPPRCMHSVMANKTFIHFFACKMRLGIIYKNRAIYYKIRNI